MYFLFYQIFGLESDVLRICNCLHIRSRPGEVKCSSQLLGMSTRGNTEYSELLGWSQFTQCPPATHQHLVLNNGNSHHSGEKQVLGGHKGGKESKQWLSQILEGPVILCVLELGFYPGGNSSSTWLW